ncbi:UDP-N-acetylglucosamine 2-epimerase (hydrolyzing) [Polynucleobacter paneuropaeus]|nr:UDP-N-acetylglucosamine 2-epimerase (hydrolyzing) [Polynucleobacter paneuropaeus]
MTQSLSEVGTPLANKRLLFVTGTRADYGKLEPLASAAQKARCHISFFITGMHMMKRYGETRLEVRKFLGADFFEYVNQREGDTQDLILSKTILGFSDFLNEHRPDLVVIHGDRIEAMGASIVCALNYIHSAHIEGGEVSGTIDESIRHCNTKLCATHFVSSEAAKQRVLSLGEQKNRIFNIGSPELDSHMSSSGISIEEVKLHYEIPFSDYGIVIFHPVTSELGDIGGQAESLFVSLERSKRCYVVILPNNDPGSDRILSAINKLPLERFRVIPSMRFYYFSELMKNASIMIGNSSTGVREAPFLGLPSIDIGSRQNNRAQSTSVMSCSAYDELTLLNLIKKYWGKKSIQDTSFGSGLASSNFINVISSSSFWDIPMQKEFNSHE